MKRVKKKEITTSSLESSTKSKKKNKKNAPRELSTIESDIEEEEEEEDEDMKIYTIADLMEEDNLHLGDIDPDVSSCDMTMTFEAMKSAQAKCHEFMFPRERREATELQMGELLAHNRALQKELEQRERAQCTLAERALSEVLRLRTQLSRAVKVSAAAAALPIPSAPSRETAAAQIVDLSKRERELSAELGTQQNKARKAEARVMTLRHKLNKLTGAQPPEGGDGECSQSSAAGVGSVSGHSGHSGSGGGGGDSSAVKKASDGVTLAQAKQQLQRDTQRLQDLHSQNEELRREMDVARQVLALEMGDAVAVAAALSGGGSGGGGGGGGGGGSGSSTCGWRTRSQLVMALHQRTGDLRQQVKDVQDELARLKAEVTSAEAAGAGDAPAPVPATHQETQTDLWSWNLTSSSTGPLAGAKAAAAGAAARERRAAAEAAEVNARAAREAAEAAERRLEAARARGRALEVTAAALRRRLEELLEESNADDCVVANLSGQLRSVTERLERADKDLEQATLRIAEERGELEDALEAATAEVSTLQAAIAEDESIIQRRQAMQAQSAQMMSRSANASSAGISALEVEVGSVGGGGGGSSGPWRRDHSPRSLSPMSRGSDSQAENEMHTKEVLSVADVDCARLLELASVHCGKIAEQASANARSEDELLSERRRAASLEAYKARLEATRQGGKARRALQMRDAADSADAELMARLELLEEENEALRSGIQRTRVETEDDLQSMAEDLRRRGITKWSSPRGAQPDCPSEDDDGDP